MDYIMAAGIAGSLLLVTGAAWPENLKVKPHRSFKNWLFAVGGLFMFIYALLGYFAGATVFFVFLEGIILVASFLMMIDAPDKVDFTVIPVLGGLLIVWSLFLFEGINTIFFVLGLSGIALGYALQGGTLKRSVALMSGSALIALFSYIEQSWIFFFMNIFFAIFAGYYVVAAVRAKRKKHWYDPIVSFPKFRK